MYKVLDTSILKGKQHIHFIGAGGSGMYPLVQILITIPPTRWRLSGVWAWMWSSASGPKTSRGQI